jgi:hypothetical protein
MRAPRIHIVVGWNHNEGHMFAWYFDADDARVHADRLNAENRDDYAVKIEECEAGEPMPERHRW